MAFSPDGKRHRHRAVTDRTAKVWDADDGQATWLTLKGHTTSASTAWRSAPTADALVTGER